MRAKNPGEAIRSGFALIPEDRRKQGLVLIHSVKENAVLPKIKQLRKHGFFIDEKRPTRSWRTMSGS